MSGEAAARTRSLAAVAEYVGGILLIAHGRPLSIRLDDPADSPLGDRQA